MYVLIKESTGNIKHNFSKAFRQIAHSLSSADKSTNIIGVSWRLQFLIFVSLFQQAPTMISFMYANVKTFFLLLLFARH